MVSKSLESEPVVNNQHPIIAEIQEKLTTIPADELEKFLELLIKLLDNPQRIAQALRLYEDREQESNEYDILYDQLRPHIEKTHEIIGITPDLQNMTFQTPEDELRFVDQVIETMKGIQTVMGTTTLERGYAAIYETAATYLRMLWQRLLWLDRESDSWPKIPQFKSLIQSQD